MKKTMRNTKTVAVASNNCMKSVCHNIYVSMITAQLQDEQGRGAVARHSTIQSRFESS